MALKTGSDHYHASLDNLAPADVYLGRAKEMQTRREEIKQRTLELRRQQHRPMLLQGASVSRGQAEKVCLNFRLFRENGVAKVTARLCLGRVP